MDETIFSSGIDYLTLTAKNGQPWLGDLKQWFDVEMMAAAGQEGQPQKFAPQGYHGYATEHLFYGERADGLMFRASSDIAHKLAKDARAHGWKIKPTRIDLEVTTDRAALPSTFATGLRAEIRGFERRNEREKSVRLDLVEGSDSGDSLSIGSRRARRYLRIYHKSAQSKNAVKPNLIRYELEVKRECARGTWDQIRTCDSIEQLAIDHVAKALEKKGVLPMWRTVARPCKLPTHKATSTEERRIEWLINQVAPVVRRIEDEDSRRRIAIAFGFKIPEFHDEA